MIHYYVFKYWSRILVGLMVSLVFGYIGFVSFSLSAGDRLVSRQNEALIAQLTGTPQVNPLLKKSAGVLGKIQNLKLKKQDTSDLETLYAASVKNLSNQKPKEAEKQLNSLETQIAKINDNLTVTPSPGPSVMPTISIVPSGSIDPTASSSGSSDVKKENF